MTDHATTEAVLAAGGTIVIRHHLGTPGIMGEDTVAVDPEEPGYTAVLVDAVGVAIRCGGGATVAEALDDLDAHVEVVGESPF